MLREEGGDDLAIAVRPAHAQRQRLERAAEHPAGMRVEPGADRGAQEADGLDRLPRPERRAGDQVGVAADVLGERVDGDVGAVPERLLVERPEEGVVADHHRAMALPLADGVGDLPHEGDVDERVERVRRRLDLDHRDAALRHRLVRRLAHARLVHPVPEAHAADAEIGERPRDQRLGSAVERLRV
jgi:hypothetical protein